MRVVLDTNVWASALLNEGTCARLKAYLTAGSGVLYVSEFILEELDRTMVRKFRWSKEKRRSLLNYIRDVAVLVEPKAIPRVAPDKTDDAILACALEAKAQYIVTGDATLRGVGKWRGITILTPRELLTQLRKAA